MTQANQSISPDVAAPEKSGTSIGKYVIGASAGLGGIIVLLFLIGLGLAIFSPAEVTAARIQIIRDIFIIIMALEFIVIILALAVLILQVARLINLLQNEVKPILENTQDTVNSAKGTVEFVSSNVTRPLIRAGGFIAGTSVFIRELGGIRRAVRPNGRGKSDE
jgi:hypothetical protein